MASPDPVRTHPPRDMTRRTPRPRCTCRGTRSPAGKTSTSSSGPHGVARAGASTPAATAPGAEQVTGTGRDAASAAISGAGHGPGSYPMIVHRNANGSLDLTIPKGPGYQESVRVHVEAGPDVHIDLGTTLRRQPGRPRHARDRCGRGQPDAGYAGRPPWGLNVPVPAGGPSASPPHAPQPTPSPASPSGAAAPGPASPGPASPGPASPGPGQLAASGSREPRPRPPRRAFRPPRPRPPLRPHQLPQIRRKVGLPSPPSLPPQAGATAAGPRRRTRPAPAVAAERGAVRGRPA